MTNDQMQVYNLIKKEGFVPFIVADLTNMRIEVYMVDNIRYKFYLIKDKNGNAIVKDTMMLDSIEIKSK